MKKLAMILAGTLMVMGTSAFAQTTTTVEERIGGGVSLLLGGSFCMESGDAECDGVDASFGMAVSPMYRFSNYLAAALDITYGMYSPEIDDVSASAFSILIGPRAYLPNGPVDIFAGIGLGYASHSVEGDGGEASAGGFGLGLTAGVEYRVIKNLAIGISGRININFADEVCVELKGQSEQCVEADVANNAMFGAQATLYF